MDRSVFFLTESSSGLPQRPRLWNRDRAKRHLTPKLLKTTQNYYATGFGHAVALSVCRTGSGRLWTLTPGLRQPFGAGGVALSQRKRNRSRSERLAESWSLSPESPGASPTGRESDGMPEAYRIVVLSSFE